MRVLYVDDADSVRFFAPDPDAPAGAGRVREMVFVGTRAAALAELARVTFDAVVLDLGLPDAPRPLELAREVRALHTGLIIIASGNDLARDVANSIGAACLMKPFGPKALAHALGVAA